MIFPSSSSEGECETEGSFEHTPGIFINLCTSDVENAPASAPVRYFSTESAPTYKQVCEPSSSTTQTACTSCGLGGHQPARCSLMWRKYKLKVQLNKALLASVTDSLNKWCYHCAQSGHFGDDCLRRRPKSQFTAFHAPLFSYLSKAAATMERSTSPSKTRLTESPPKPAQKRKHPLSNKQNKNKRKKKIQ